AVAEIEHQVPAGWEPGEPGNAGRKVRRAEPPVILLDDGSPRLQRRRPAPVHEVGVVVGRRHGGLWLVVCGWWSVDGCYGMCEEPCPSPKSPDTKHQPLITNHESLVRAESGVRPSDLKASYLSYPIPQALLRSGRPASIRTVV